MASKSLRNPLDEEEVGVEKVGRADGALLALLPAAEVRVLHQIVAKNLNRKNFYCTKDPEWVAVHWIYRKKGSNEEPSVETKHFCSHWESSCYYVWKIISNTDTHYFCDQCKKECDQVYTQDGYTYLCEEHYLKRKEADEDGLRK